MILSRHFPKKCKNREIPLRTVKPDFSESLDSESSTWHLMNFISF